MAKPAAHVTVTYSREGPVEELRGKQFSVPRDVVDKAAYIEAGYAEQEAKRIAAEAKERRDQQVLNDRIEAQARLEAAMPTERLEALEEELKTLREAQAELPSAEELHGISNQILASHNNLMSGQQHLLTASGQLEESSQKLAQQAAEVEAERQQAEEFHRQGVQVSKNSVEFSNLAQAQFAKERAEYQAEIARLQEVVRDMAGQMNQHMGLVAAAEKISQASIERQEQQMQAYVNQLQSEYSEKFVDMMGFYATALGLDKAQLSMTANQLDVDPQRAVLLDERTINYYAEIMRASRGMADKAQAAS